MHQQKHETTPSNEKEGNTRSITDILPSAQCLLSCKVSIQEPPISVELIDYLMDYVKMNSQIKAVAVIGFNKGMLLGFEDRSSCVGLIAESFLKAREDIIVVAFDPLEHPYVSNQARYLSQHYPNRFMLTGGLLSESIRTFSGFLDIQRFDLIYIASASYPRSTSRF